MDAKPPMRHRDVPSTAPGKLFQRAVARLLRARFLLLTFLSREQRKVSRQVAKKSHQPAEEPGIPKVYVFGFDAV
jgi:hypothetical protein